MFEFAQRYQAESDDEEDKIDRYATAKLVCNSENSSPCITVLQSSLMTNTANENYHKEYSPSIYHQLQTVSFTPVQQPTFDNHPHNPSFYARNTEFDSHQVVSQQILPTLNATTINDNSYTAPVTTTTEIPAKRRRAATAASQINNSISGAGAGNSSSAVPASKSMSETAQIVFNINQLMKPLFKLCEEINEINQEILKQISEQTRLFNELNNLPRELQKSTQQLPHVLHMQAKVLQIRQENDNDNSIIELNGVNLCNVPRGASLNATARSLVRAAYGETASFNNLSQLDFDTVLTAVGRIHGVHPSSVFANCNSIKNSLQQMKHDNSKKSSSSKSTPTLQRRRASTAESLVISDDDAENVL